MADQTKGMPLQTDKSGLYSPSQKPILHYNCKDTVGRQICNKYELSINRLINELEMSKCRH